MNLVDSRTVADIVSATFRALNDAAIRYCVLRGYESLPERVEGSDIDVLIHPSDAARARKVILDSGLTTRIGPRQRPWYSFAYAGAEHAWVIFHFQSRSMLLSAPVVEAVLGGVVKHPKGFFVPSAGHKTALMIVRDIVQLGEFRDRHARALEGDLSASPSPAFLAGFSEILAAYGLPGSLPERLKARLYPLDLEAMILDKDEIVQALFQARKPEAIKPEVAAPSPFRRAGRRILRPFRAKAPTRGPLLVLAIVGIDGAGKSTLISGLRDKTPDKIPLVSVSMKAKDPVTTSGRAARNQRTSAKGLGFIFDIKSAWADAYDKRVRAKAALSTAEQTNAIVLYDRWVDDTVLALLSKGRRRKAYLLRFFQNLLVPAPDAFLFLSLTPEQARGRKQENPPEELARRDAQYRRNYVGRKNVEILLADRNAEEVHGLACEAIARLSLMKERRLPE